MPKSPRPPAIATPGNNEVPTVAAEKIRAAPPVTIGKTTKESSSSSKLHFVFLHLPPLQLFLHFENGVVLSERGQVSDGSSNPSSFVQYPSNINLESLEL